MKTHTKLTQVYLFLILGLLTRTVFGMTEITINIRDHLFFPREVTVPANQKVKLYFINHDPTPEEIDSFSLNREKVIFQNSSGSIYIGPLKPGDYPFFGEFHPNSAVGKVIVKPDNGINDVN
ncbi:cupredoxin domain-containing protein [Alteromonas sp. C1M14]|uniref:cupredoxin domain-containing protein n=1 Tax=Alteromonas sp. C1M14 TaxID=2841567 RepID=UPI001C093AFA|nr:cupredoxin domain-containing protein [Alteromonas sp. C1M14]MBU2977393.1 cupredoxin domain-containing protein [Alteromonas sp. C1M14]